MILLFVFENYLIAAAAATMREQFFETHLFPTILLLNSRDTGKAKRDIIHCICFMCCCLRWIKVIATKEIHGLGRLHVDISWMFVVRAYGAALEIAMRLKHLKVFFGRRPVLRSFATTPNRFSCTLIFWGISALWSPHWLRSLSFLFHIRRGRTRDFSVGSPHGDWGTDLAHARKGCLVLNQYRRFNYIWI